MLFVKVKCQTVTTWLDDCGEKVDKNETKLREEQQRGNFGHRFYLNLRCHRDKLFYLHVESIANSGTENAGGEKGNFLYKKELQYMINCKFLL
ncbi:hypothetical protein RRG08_063598 [Elysia crispata]|uniref:Uncharacterized protein n=1 Tax=Elysia crispata TaxID=231223 RepID=A0AAE0YRD9_9GAST|nr:hypothetical protein RRG08_063598 [Elysia crispata]